MQSEEEHNLSSDSDSSSMSTSDLEDFDVIQELEYLEKKPLDNENEFSYVLNRNVLMEEWKQTRAKYI